MTALAAVSAVSAAAAPGRLTGPFFEVGPKSRLRLTQLELVAQAAGRAGSEHGVSIVMTVPTAHIGPLAAAGTGVLLFAQGMDADPMGEGMGLTYPESLVDAGAAGVMLNHDSRPLSPEALAASVERARACGLETVVCAGSEAEMEQAVLLRPTAVLFEPPALIGTATTGERTWIAPANALARGIAPGVLMMHAGGVSSPAVAEAVMAAGADGTGSTSGVLGAPEPLQAVRAFVAATRTGWDAAHRG